ncbi:MAG: DUF2779 domain-containing protein [Campylobacterales bacterium]
MSLSKSLYTRGIQCPKSLWLKKYNPDVLTPPDAAALARFETGNVVGDLACDLFPGGREVDYDASDFAGMAETTKRWLDEGLEHVYEATFIYEGIVVMVDILRRSPGGVEIYEVKSSGDVKEIYLHDVSIQQYVLERLGYNVLRSHVVHIDTSYVRGDALDLHGLFKIVDVTAEADALQSDIPLKLSEFETYLADRVHEPAIEIGKQCKKPYDCDAIDYCWKVQRNIPDYSVFNIFSLGSKKQVELYERGIVNIEDIPDDYPMTAAQKKKVDIVKQHKVHIDQEQIEAFLGTLTNPLYHLDFDTFQQAVPKWKGIKPYQQIPFQFSLHIEHQGGTLEHREFLAREGIDPRRELAQRLVEEIPAGVTALAYNMAFEKRVIADLADAFPDLAGHLLAINENMKDLMVPFQKQHYVTPDMRGSYSIKYVLPALVPEMEQAYKQLEGVQNGGDAMLAFAHLESVPPEKRPEVRSALLRYCELDTLAMVKILQALRTAVG